MTSVACVRLAFAVFVLSAPGLGQFPDGPGKDTVQRVCGTCHSSSMVLGRHMSRDQWSEVVTNMINRGAKGTPQEFADVIDYLAKSFPAQAQDGSSATSKMATPPATPAKSVFPAGPTSQQVVDLAGAARGKALYSARCGACHGPMARGGAAGPDVIRSVRVLHDRYGDTIGPFLNKTHPPANGRPLAALNDGQVKDLSHFLHQQVADVLRSGPYTKVLNVLTGDATAGAAYFRNGCASCHSATGDLAGIASRYDAPNLQQRLLFPRSVGFSKGGISPPKPVMVTVTAADAGAVSGTLVRLDDFNVTLKDAGGQFHTWARTPQLKVEKHDPYAGHDELLDQYTDKDIHNLVAYLETLK